MGSGSSANRSTKNGHLESKKQAVSKIIDGLCLGTRYAVGGKNKFGLVPNNNFVSTTLKEHGFTHILAIDHVEPPIDLKAQKILVLAPKKKAATLESVLKPAVKFIECPIAGGRVLVYDVAGDGEAAAAIVAYLIHHKRQDVSSSMKIAKMLRPSIAIDSYNKSLKMLYQELAHKWASESDLDRKLQMETSLLVDDIVSKMDPMSVATAATDSARSNIAQQLQARQRSLRGIQQILSAHNRVVNRIRDANATNKQLAEQVELLKQENMILKHQSSKSQNDIVVSEEAKAKLVEKDQQIAMLNAEMCQLLKDKNKISTDEVEVYKQLRLLEESLKEREKALAKMSKESMILEDNNDKLKKALDKKTQEYQILDDEFRAVKLESTTLETQLESKQNEFDALMERWLKEKEKLAEMMNASNMQASRIANERVKAELLAAAENREVDEDVGTFIQSFGPTSAVPTEAMYRKEAHRGDIVSCAFDPRGKQFATGSSDKEIKIWDSCGNSMATLHGSKATVSCLLFNPEGRTLAAGCADSTIKLYNLKTQRVEHTMNNHTERILGMAYVNAGSVLFSTSKDHTIKCWDLRRGVMKSSLLCDATCYALAPFEMSCLVGAHFDKTLRVRDPRADLKAVAAQIDTEHTGAITHICISPVHDHYVLTSSKDSTLQEFDMRALKLVARYVDPSYTVDRAVGCQPSYSPDGSFITCGSTTGTVHIWEAASGNVHSSLDGGHSCSVTSCLWSPEGSTLVTVAKDKNFVVWSS